MNTQIKFTTAAEAVKVIKSGDHIHLSSVASAPQCLIKAMCERGANHEFKDVHIHHLHTEGPAPYADPQFEGIFQLDSFFVGGNVRKVTQSGYADYIPIFLSETQKLYRSGTVPCDVAMIQVSTPDKHGYVSLGTSVDATLAAVETARTVIAVVNKHVPRSFGDAMIHSSKIDLFVQDDTPLEEAHFTEPNEIETRIGKHCAALIEDGATLQMGIGAIPNAVLAQLGNHKNLGIHTEMFADGVLPLVEKGVINGEAKNIDKGKMVSTFLMGSQRVYDFIDDNPGVLMMDVGYTNDPYIISQNDKMMDCIHVFDEITDNLPQNEASFNLAKQNLMKSIQSRRVTKAGVINAYFNAKLMGIDYDVTKLYYEQLPSLTLQDITNFEKQNIVGKPYRMVILGDEKNLDMKSLEKIAPIKRLSQEEIFGY